MVAPYAPCFALALTLRAALHSQLLSSLNNYKDKDDSDKGKWLQ